MEGTEMFTDAHGTTYVHPSQMTDQQRREANADLHDRFARAFQTVGDQRSAATARKAAARARSAR